MALKKEFVILTTAGRLVLPLYIWACPQNVLAIDTSRELSYPPSLPLLILVIQAGSTFSASTTLPKRLSSSSKTPA